MDSTLTLTGALVTASSATGVLSTRTGRAPAGAMVKVPEALTPAWGAAPAGSVRPAGIPQVDQQQLRRCRSGSRDKRRLDKQQPTPVKFRLHSIARERRTGSDTEVSDGCRWEAEPVRPGPPSRPRGRASSPHLRRGSWLPQRRSHVRRLSLRSRSSRAWLGDSRKGVTLVPTSQPNCGAVAPPEVSKPQTPSSPKIPTQAQYSPAAPAGQPCLYSRARRPRARA